MVALAVLSSIYLSGGGDSMYLNLGTKLSLSYHYTLP